MNDIRNDEVVRLRVATDRAIGTTAFFRNRSLWKVLFGEMESHGREHYSVLFHASSIGAEVYSFVIHYLRHGYGKKFSLSVHAVDLEPTFVEYAQNGSYPSVILNGLQEEERSFFTQEGDTVQVAEIVKRHIQFPGAVNFMDFETDQEYDLVFLLNALIYVPAEKQALLLDRISSYNTTFLLTTGFHMESIRQDLVRNGYEPIAKNLKTIHDGWTDRRVVLPVSESRPGIYTDWTLPEFAEIKDYKYKFCSLFKKSASIPG